MLPAHQPCVEGVTKPSSGAASAFPLPEIDERPLASAALVLVLSTERGPGQDKYKRGKG